MAEFKGRSRRLLLVEALFMSLLVMELASTQVSGKKHVHVTSAMGDGETIYVHCKSKDNDLGVQKLENGQGFQWSFHVNLFRTTLFYCNVSWRDISDFYFDAYDYQRDRYVCSDCRWLFAPEGLYSWNDDNQGWVFRYDWRP
ncbi:Plant self-incompatibility S1 [Corchorus olitorius]|uniref:S-protein homolog n=1 Tax=Corchorus olitorius TaxID=93759 RepID=A0A1R3K683_9ROSI|nr:Plant self-incompatibility S1 [Corchorus olitorius]